MKNKELCVCVCVCNVALGVCVYRTLCWSIVVVVEFYVIELFVMLFQVLISVV